MHPYNHKVTPSTVMQSAKQDNIQQHHLGFTQFPVKGTFGQGILNNTFQHISWQIETVWQQICAIIQTWFLMHNVGTVIVKTGKNMILYTGLKIYITSLI